MEKNMPKCKIHPTELITNYCTQMNCFMQLCAACICDHTQFHNKSNTKPKFQLLKTTYQNTNDNMNKIKQMLIQQKNLAINVIEKINKQKNQVEAFLRKVRQQVIATVHRSFDQLQINYYNHLQVEKQKTGLLNELRLNQVYAQLTQRSQEVNNLTEQLKNYKNPKLIRTINTQFIPKFKTNLDEINKQLLANLNFQPSLTYRPANLQQIAASIKKLFITNMSYNIGQYNRVTRSISKNKDNLFKPINNRQISLRKQSLYGFRNQTDLKSPRIIQFRKVNNMAATINQNYFPNNNIEQYSYKAFSNTYT